MHAPGACAVVEEEGSGEREQSSARCCQDTGEPVDGIQGSSQVSSRYGVFLSHFSVLTEVGEG